MRKKCLCQLIDSNILPLNLAYKIIVYALKNESDLVTHRNPEGFGVCSVPAAQKHKFRNILLETHINYSHCFVTDLNFYCFPWLPSYNTSHLHLLFSTAFLNLPLFSPYCPSFLPLLSFQGLEVSKPGRYQALPSDNFTEMSNLGAEFITSPLPLDSDTDAPMISTSHRPLLKDLSPAAVTGGIQSDSLEAQRTPDSTMSPTANLQSLAVNTPDCSAVSPGTASRGTAGSDSCKTEGDTEQKEAEGSVQSTWNQF